MSDGKRPRHGWACASEDQHVGESKVCDCGLDVLRERMPRVRDALAHLIQAVAADERTEIADRMRDGRKALLETQ